MLRLLVRVIVCLVMSVSISAAAEVSPAATDGQCLTSPGWAQIASPQQPRTINGVETRALGGVASGWGQPGQLFVGGFGGLFRSEDCGRNWQQLVPSLSPGVSLGPGVFVTVLGVSPFGTLYIDGAYGHLMISPDEGETWREVRINTHERGPLPAMGHYVAPSSKTDGLAYAILGDDQGLGRFYGSYRTRDGGLTWTLVDVGGPYLTLDPLDDESLFYSRFEALWQVKIATRATRQLAKFDSSITAIAVSPDGSHFWVATTNGSLYLSRDQGGSWEQVGDVSYQGHLISLSASPHDPRLLFAVTDQNELWAYLEPGPADFPIEGGHFYTQASGQGAGSRGYAVTDEDGVPFYSAFSSLPLETVGYPISSRFTYRGFVTQAFQKLVLQHQPGVGVVYLNTFDELHDAGKDPWLQAERLTPPPEDTSADTRLPWEEVAARHLAILDRDPVLKEAFLSEPRHLELYGLPTSYADYPEASVVRAQRAALQRWKADLPWARAGEVTVANGGELMKEAGLFPREALTPQLPPAR